MLSVKQLLLSKLVNNIISPVLRERITHENLWLGLIYLSQLAVAPRISGSGLPICGRRLGEALRDSGCARFLLIASVRQCQLPSLMRCFDQRAKRRSYLDPKQILVYGIPLPASERVLTVLSCVPRRPFSSVEPCYYCSLSRCYTAP